MLKTPTTEPKMKKSALAQISVMMTDTSLHQIFIEENGLPLILDILSKALVSCPLDVEIPYLLFD